MIDKPSMQDLFENKLSWLSVSSYTPVLCLVCLNLKQWIVTITEHNTFGDLP